MNHHNRLTESASSLAPAGGKSFFSRRALLAGAGGLSLLAWSRRAQAQAGPVTMRTVTRGPRFHWFGYYDKWQFDPSDRYLLSNEVTFQQRTPLPGDALKLGMIDLQDGDRWIELGESLAWGWQQGCMLQWLPGSSSEVIFNDREGDRFVSRILDVKNNTRRTLDGPIYTVSPDATLALAPDFRRLHDTRPGYGYAGVPDPNAAVAAPTNAGIWQVDLRTGANRLLLSFAAIVDIPHATPWPAGAKHWANHLLYAPDGKRVVFLHRWSAPSFTGFRTRMITMNPDGSDPYVLNPPEMTSHFIWRDGQHILAWSARPSTGNKFHLFTDKTQNTVVIGNGVLTQDGHCTYLPRHNNEWVLNDTYPDSARLQHVHLFHIPTGRLVTLGRFLSPTEYRQEFRCDTHPRFSRDGTKVVIDSPHTGAGRQQHIIDISSIVGPPLPETTPQVDGGARDASVDDGPANVDAAADRAPGTGGVGGGGTGGGGGGAPLGDAGAADSVTGGAGGASTGGSAGAPVATGGNANAGGVTGGGGAVTSSGGAFGSGGAPGTGGVPVNTGGGGGGGIGVTPPPQSPASGCGCELASTGPLSLPGLVVGLGLALGAATGRRARRQAATKAPGHTIRDVNEEPAPPDKPEGPPS